MSPARVMGWGLALLVASIGVGAAACVLAVIIGVVEAVVR